MLLCTAIVVDSLPQTHQAIEMLFSYINIHA
jgi:hypothetical protein